MEQFLGTEVVTKVRLLSRAESGFRSRLMVGSRPQVRLADVYFTAAIAWLDSDALHPGEEAQGRMVLVHPLADLPGLHTGSCYDLTDGARKIGEMEILGIRERTFKPGQL